MVKAAPGNWIEGNTITGISGRGIVLDSSAADTVVRDNKVVGQGSKALDLTQAVSVTALFLQANDTADWIQTGPPTAGERFVNFFRYHPALPL